MSWSTYNYVLGNPVSYVDPTGRSAEDSDGKEKDEEDSDGQQISIIEGDPPIISSEDITSGNGNDRPTTYPSNVEKFADAVNKLPSTPLGKMNIVTIVIELPYSIDAETILGDRYNQSNSDMIRRENSLLLATLPEELRNHLQAEINKTNPAPVLQIQTLNEAYEFAHESILNADINKKVYIETSVRLKRVNCGDSGSDKCNDRSHSPNSNTKIKYNFSYSPMRA